MNQIIAEKLALIAENEQKVYDKGKTDGTAEGYQSGYTEGYTAGYAEGEASGGGGSDFPVEEYLAKTATELTLTGATTLTENSIYKQNMLKTLYLPDVTKIDSLAVVSCSELNIVVMGEGLVTIGSGAGSVFSLCPKIVHLDIPSTVKTINWSALTGCTSLVSVTFLGTPETIGSVVSSTVLPTSVKTINVPWAEDEVPGAPWGATAFENINYGYTKEE